MVDIYNIPLYYISKHSNNTIEKHYKRYGFRNINHFPLYTDKINLKSLLDTQKISIRVYDELNLGKTDYTGISDIEELKYMITVFKLWELCIKQGLQFICICNEKNRMEKRLGDSKKGIEDMLENRNSLITSGSEFMICSIGACKNLVKYFYPINISLNNYFQNVEKRGDIFWDDLSLSTNYDKFPIKDSCRLCWLPDNKWVYICITILIVSLVIGTIIYFKKYRNCRSSQSYSSFEE